MTKRLLIVEHHAPIAEITSEILRDFGYEVRCVTHAVAALAVLEADTRGFDLVSIDVLTPDQMSGVDLACELSRRWPGLPVLLIIGDSNFLARNEDLSGDFQVLRKSYSAEALTDLIGNMIRVAQAAAASPA